jgi:predicted unusual protein kinase regulating ubiquinone biosynthesis (AarF/ABC1/UbiB family)
MAKVKLTRLDEVPLSEIFFEMLSIARKNKVILEANFTTLIIGTVVIEGYFLTVPPHPRVGPRHVAVDVWLTTHTRTRTRTTYHLTGLGRQLDPDLNLLQRAVPLLVKDRAIRDAYIKARLSARLPSLFRQATSVPNP